jgi:hypothetical protein
LWAAAAMLNLPVRLVHSYRFHQTDHFILRSDERHLSIENIKNVVRYPDKQKRIRKGEHSGVVYAFEKEVDEVVLKVVAEIKASECWLMTAYEPS